MAQLEDVVEFDGRRVLYQWIGGTRSDWRGQGHFRALTEEQEVWALGQRVRRDPRQDQEQVLRDARRAGAAATTTSIRFVPSTTDNRRVEGVPQQAARPARRRQPPQPPDRSPAATARLGRYGQTAAFAAMIRHRQADDPRRSTRLSRRRRSGRAASATGLFVAEGRLIVERLLLDGRYSRPLHRRDAPGGGRAGARVRATARRSRPRLRSRPSSRRSPDSTSIAAASRWRCGTPTTFPLDSRLARARACSRSRGSATPTTSAACSASAFALGVGRRPARSASRRSAVSQGDPHVDGGVAARAVRASRAVAVGARRVEGARIPRRRADARSRRDVD